MLLVVQQAEITIDQKVDFQIDGEYMGEIDHLTHLDSSFSGSCVDKLMSQTAPILLSFYGAIQWNQKSFYRTAHIFVSSGL